MWITLLNVISTRVNHVSNIIFNDNKIETNFIYL